ncbi:FAD/NAD(P)-binding protein [Sphingomonas sp. NPDC019816]|uniref:FAD/NAD(P)-binding protein n=1 Tax=Sphingomonas sp. NPDC019816 TaxID=3390679 RepID=UPI003D019B43
MTSGIDHVAIIGGGFAGTLLAINLVRHGGPRATLIERHAGQLARGVAYSAAHAEHLLNVRAGNMSALRDDPDHFVRWLRARGAGDARTFVPRRVYGDYLRNLLMETIAADPTRLTLAQGEVSALTRDGAGFRLALAEGREMTADAVVLALGNLPPHTPPGIDPSVLAQGCYREDPWAGDIAEGLRDDDRVLLVGSGLTAIDAALLLDANGFGGRTLALSRRGLAPRRHADSPPVQPLRERPAASLSALVRHVRRVAGEQGWRGAVDSLRPVTQMMWGAADGETRARFLRHLRPYWDVHRHRLAPAIAEAVDRLIACGRFTIMGGKLIRVEPEGAGAIVHWRPRGQDGVEILRVARIVNCTGPQGDLLRSREPLIRQLLAQGMIRPDALRIGLEVDAQSHVVTADGSVDDRLYCIGPMTRGGLWEVVAVPDLRQQNWDLARRLAHAQWVGGEGL